MNTEDILTLAVKSISNKQLRSWLTIIGIVIGVATIVLMISMGDAFRVVIIKTLGQFGTDIITIVPGAESASFGPGRPPGQTVSFIKSNLTENDAKMIKSLPGVQYVSGSVSDKKEVSYAGQSATLSVEGVDASSWRFLTATELESGRYLSAGDSNVAVIGNKVAHTIYKNEIKQNYLVSVSGQQFRVVGVLKSGGIITQEDNSIFIPKERARSLMEIGEKDLSKITVKVSDPDSIADIGEKIKERLRASHRVQEGSEDFSIISLESIKSRVDEVLASTNAFLGGMAFIALLVGTIGIINTMFMTVMERTRQIGTLKALGMNNFTIMLLYLSESSIIGLVGGVIGIGAAILISPILSAVMQFGALEALAISVSPELIVGALLLSTIIGMIGGVLPAMRAARLQPVEALRYE